MEEKTDKVVGYIEYLGAGGMIGEIVPYTSVEKFKDEILDSLDCGRPVTPVVFSDELDEPLQFDSDTYFPWGFRSEKRAQIPYEIEQLWKRCETARLCVGNGIITEKISTTLPPSALMKCVMQLLLQWTP